MERHFPLLAVKADLWCAHCWTVLVGCCSDTFVWQNIHSVSVSNVSASQPAVCCMRMLNVTADMSTSDFESFVSVAEKWLSK